MGKRAATLDERLMIVAETMARQYCMHSGEPDTTLNRARMAGLKTSAPTLYRNLLVDAAAILDALDRADATE